MVFFKIIECILNAVASADSNWFEQEYALIQGLFLGARIASKFSIDDVLFFFNCTFGWMLPDLMLIKTNQSMAIT